MLEKRPEQGNRPKFPYKKEKYLIEAEAKKRGLDPYPIRFEMVDHEEMSELAAYAGYPVRYSHWLFGQESLRLKTSYNFGLHIIYEMIIATNPSYAYLLDANPSVIQKQVMGHVYGHSDFFKNNVWCRMVPTDLHNQFADNAKRVEELRTKEGKEEVDLFLEACLSVATLCDFMNPRELDELDSRKPEQLSDDPTKLQFREKLPEYMDKCVNPKDWLDAQREAIDFEKERRKDINRGFINPPEPVYDVLGFCLKHASLEPWQKEIIEVIREEQHSLYRNGLTKIMNEGWAAYWEADIMTSKGVLEDSEICHFANTFAGVQSGGGSLNPYRLGLALWEDIKKRWNTGRHGLIWTTCEDRAILDRWDEFIVYKLFCDQYGKSPDDLNRNWLEFSAFVTETEAGRGVCEPAFFYPDNYVVEWLKYLEDDSYETMRSQIRERPRSFQELDVPECWKEWTKKNEMIGGLGRGLEKMLEVRRTYNDLAFLQEFFTEEFCERNKYFLVGLGTLPGDYYNPPDDEKNDANRYHYMVKSREYQRIKKRLLNHVLNLGLPKVAICNANHENNNELLLVHLHDGRDLDQISIVQVMERIYRIWGKQKTVYLETMFTHYPKRRPWWDVWTPPGSPKPKPQKIIREWRRYRYEGVYPVKAQKIPFNGISQEIIDLVPALKEFLEN